MSIEDSRSETLQEPKPVIATLVSPSREPSAATRSAIQAWVRDIHSGGPSSAIEAAACAVLTDLLDDFSRSYTWNQVRNLLPATVEVRSMPSVAARMRTIATKLCEQHAADQAMQVHHSERGPLWVSFQTPEPTTADGETIGYGEVPVTLTTLGRILYGRLPSRSRWAAPQVYPTLRVVIPFFVFLYLFYHGLFTGRAWMVVLSMAIAGNLAVAVFRLLKLPVTQAHLVQWPYVRGAGRFSVIHTRTKSDDRPLFRISGYSAACSICGDVVDLEHGRHAMKGRIVGECRSNPLEHLFTFDHTTGKGRWIYSQRPH